MGFGVWGLGFGVWGLGTQAMQGLGMQGGRFDVALNMLEQPSQHGQEHIEFLVAGHSGSTPRPVGKVASGGEIGRAHV